MILAIQNLSLIIKIAAGGAVAAGAWIVLDLLSNRKGRAEDRLDVLRRVPGGGKDDSSRMARSSDALAGMLEKTTPMFAKPLQPKTEKEAGKLKQRLVHAGFRRDSAPSIFLGSKLLMLIIGLVAGGGTMALVMGVSKSMMMRSGGIAIFMFFVPDIVLWYIGKKRKEAIFLSLPDTLDLMVVCVEAGLGLDQAMRRVAEEMEHTYKVICDEFNICNLQLQMGRARNDVLQELGARTGVDDLRALASILIQADKFGASVGQALRVQSDAMRTRRQQIAEEKAAKTAVQLIFPLVIFIFPGVFVVLVGPAAITIVREMFPMLEAAGN